MRCPNADDGLIHEALAGLDRHNRNSRHDPIRRVSMVSTGSVQIQPQHRACTWQPTWLWVLTSRQWTAPLPINVYVIEHRDGLVLFDTGQDLASITDPGYFPSGLLMGPLYRMSRFDMATNQTLSALLEGIGYRAGDVSTVVLSHLHGDHIGGLREINHAELLVSQLTETRRGLVVLATHDPGAAAALAKAETAWDAP
jgi:N-acyl homoserine lactone hydrolase